MFTTKSTKKRINDEILVGFFVSFVNFVV